MEILLARFGFWKHLLMASVLLMAFPLVLHADPIFTPTFFISLAVSAAISAATFGIQMLMRPKPKPVDKNKLQGDVQLTWVGEDIPIAEIYGAAMADGIGGFRVGGIIFYASPIRLVKVETNGDGGGGSGKGGPRRPTTIEHHYYTDLAIMVGRGPLRIKQIAANTDLLFQNFTPVSQIFGTTYESEDRTSSGGGVTDSSDGDFSSYAILPNNGYVEWNDVVCTDSSGAVELFIVYKSGADIDIEVTVNGTVYSAVLPNSYNLVAHINLPQTLTVSSSNVVRITGKTATSWKLDRIVVGETPIYDNPDDPGGGCWVSGARYVDWVNPEPTYDPYDLRDPLLSDRRGCELYNYQANRNSLGETTANIVNNGTIRIYEGNDTQLPDPLLQEHFETLYGVGATPAFRGRSYVVIENFELTKYGTVPNFTFVAEHTEIQSLGELYAHRAERAGLDPSEFDFTDLDVVPIRGYAITQKQAPVREMELLNRIFDVDVYENFDGQIVGVIPDETVVVTVPVEDMSAKEGGAQTDGGDQFAPIERLHRDEAELPYFFDASFIDSQKNHDARNVHSLRNTDTSDKKDNIETNLVMLESECQKFVDRELQKLYIEKDGLSVSLFHKYTYLTPTQKIQVTDEDGSVAGMRIKSIEGWLPGVLDVKGVSRDALEFPPRVFVVPDDVPNVPAVVVPAPVIATFLDFAAMREEQTAGFYIAVCLTDTHYQWRGAGIFRQIEGGDYEALIGINDQAVMGRTIAGTPGTLAAPVYVALSLVSYWKLNEASGDALDAHGSNNLTDTNTVGTAPGVVGDGRDFEADNSEGFSIADNASVSWGNIDATIGAWVKLESKGANRTIISKWNTSSNREYRLYFNNSTDRFVFEVSNDGTAVASVSWGSAPSTGVSYLVVAWHDATANTINIQVNNGTVVSTAHSTGVFDGNSDFRIGFLHGGSEYWDGVIDAAFLSKRVLTSTERTFVYNEGVGQKYEDWVTWDLSSAVTLDLFYGELETLTYEQVREGRNYIVIGDELVQFAKATKVGGAGSPLNVALAANGGTATASSTYSSDYVASGVNNGIRDGSGWSSPGGGWNDNTSAVWGDTMEIAFSESQEINQIDVFTLPDDYASPSAPTLSKTFSLYGLTAYDVQYWNGSSWVTVSGGSVTGNDKVWRQFTFTPVTTTKIRVVCNGGADGTWARLVEIEAWNTGTVSGAPNRWTIEHFQRFLKGTTDVVHGAQERAVLFNDAWKWLAQDPAIAGTMRTYKVVGGGDVLEQAWTTDWNWLGLSRYNLPIYQSTDGDVPTVTAAPSVGQVGTNLVINVQRPTANGFSANNVNIRVRKASDDSIVKNVELGNTLEYVTPAPAFNSKVDYRWQNNFRINGSDGWSAWSTVTDVTAGSVPAPPSEPDPGPPPPDPGDIRPICFVDGTEVWMADNSVKPIESIEPGDLVMAWNEGGRLMPCRVRAITQNTVDEYRRVTVENGQFGVTESHPFCNEYGRKFRVMDFEEGSTLRAYDRGWKLSAVQAVETVDAEDGVRVTNFDVAVAHRYFVRTGPDKPWFAVFNIKIYDEFQA